MEITVEEFDKVQICAGTVVDVAINKRAKTPAYKVTLDFGAEIGMKTSSAQITALYQPEDLIGKQLICCVNLPSMHIGSVKSQVRILGTDSEQGVVLLTPMEPVKNGDKVF
jgi:tRNA-binding protein